MSSAANKFAPRVARLFSIGQVLTALSASFPELTLSKLRFLEEQGLVTPQRTPSGYRKFGEQDIDRIKIILELQRDRYLPLKVIRNYLNDLDAGRQPSLPNAQSNGAVSYRSKIAKRLTKLELIAETAITESLLAEAVAAQLIEAEPFDAHSVEVARAIVHLQRFGISPRHLRGLKVAADRESGIIEGVVAPVISRGDEASRSRASHYAQEIDNQFSTIRAALVGRVISKIDG